MFYSSLSLVMRKLQKQLPYFLEAFGVKDKHAGPCVTLIGAVRHHPRRAVSAGCDGASEEHTGSRGTRSQFNV